MAAATYEDRLKEFIDSEFKKLADPEKAPAMAAYMKTKMPFLGIQKPERIPVYREMKKQFRPATRSDYEKGILALWGLPHREEKYAAIQYASSFDEFIGQDSLPVFERLIREGAWWDFVDPIAIELVGGALLRNRLQMTRVMDSWSEDQDLWIRRSALLSQIHHKKNTDSKKLFEYCLKLCHEKEFFIRKAIGWALRQYSYVDPQAVRAFLIKNQSRLSPLSYREGAKQLVRCGEMTPRP